ncbi:MAG: AAA family ATPase [Bradymonadales bacterium]|nr:AAA family ATPase [Bradymonadales bacterium]
MNLFEKRFVINTGKGGVGKSTITAAMALAAARKNLRVLVIELNTRERISRLFGADEVGGEISLVHDNIWSVNLTPEAAMKEYVLMKVHLETIYRVVFENRLVKQFLQVIPGLNDLVLIGKAAFHEQERDKHGNPRYDMILVDAPATGHGIFFLRIPQVITEAVPSSPMATATSEILNLLQDPDRTILNLITLTEEMAVNETIELKERIDETLDMPLGYLIANGIYPRLLRPQEVREISRLADSRGASNDLTCRLLESILFRHERCDLQASYLETLQRRIPMSLITVPYYFTPDFDLEVIRRIADHIERSVEQAVNGE